MTPSFLLATAIGVAMIMGSGVVSSNWLRKPIIILGAIVAIVAIASIGLVIWGRYIGFPWHFTP